VQGPETRQQRFIDLYECEGAHIKKKTRKALEDKFKFDRTKKEGRHDNWGILDGWFLEAKGGED
jgi:hypothetical protein